MATLYTLSRTSHAQSTTADSITLDVPAGRKLELIRLCVTGMASAAAAGAEIGVYRVTTVGSGGTPTSLTIKLGDPNGAAVPAGLTAKFGYGTQPTIEADPVVRLAYQPLGGKGRFAVQTEEVSFWSASAYQVSVRGISGTPNVAIDELTFLLH